MNLEDPWFHTNIPVNVAESIYEEAEKVGLMVDHHRPPIKVTGDCYMFYGVAQTEACRRWGGCEQHNYYAFTGSDDRVTIVNPHGEYPSL